jgi:hypothetical protein
MAFTSIIASKLLFPLSLDSSPLSYTLTPQSQTIICLLGLVELDTTHPLAYFSNITSASNLLVMGLN